MDEINPASNLPLLAVVTGGASGIGFAIAQVFLEKGYRVVILDNDEESGGQAASHLRQFGDIAYIACDVSRPEESERVVKQCIADWGRIHVLVNNAGVLGPAELLSADDEDLVKVIGINLIGSLCMSKYVIQHMKLTGGGVIINISSIVAITGSPGFPCYAVSKAGLVALTRSLAHKYARRNIRINCICPGSVLGTHLLSKSRGFDALPQERLELANKIPIGRVVRATEVARLAFFMASPETAAMTGAIVVLDGGETLAMDNVSYGEPYRSDRR